MLGAGSISPIDQRFVTTITQHVGTRRSDDRRVRHHAHRVDRVTARRVINGGSRWIWSSCAAGMSANVSITGPERAQRGQGHRGDARRRIDRPVDPDKSLAAQGFRQFGERGKAEQPDWA